MHINLNSFVLISGVISCGIFRFDNESTSCDKARDFIIRTLPNSVRSRALHRSRFVCNICNLWFGISPFSSCETWIPKILTGLGSHFSCNGLLLPFSQPDRFCFLSGLILSPVENQSYQLFLRPFLQTPGQHKKDSHHLHVGSISVRFLIFQFLGCVGLVGVLFAITSAERINQYRDGGHPWRAPLDDQSQFVKNPLFNAALSMLVWKALTHFWILVPKLKTSNVLIIN